MLRTWIVLLIVVLSIGVFVPQLAVLCLMALVLVGSAGLVWSSMYPFGRRRGGRR